MRWEKRHAFLKLQVLQPNGRLLGGFVFVSCGQFDRWSTSWFCCSLLVLWGLQVKPPIGQIGRSRLKATLRSWLNRTYAVFPPSCSIFLPLTCKDALCFVRLFLIASFLVVLCLNLMSDIQLWGAILRDFETTNADSTHFLGAFCCFLPFMNRS